MENFQIISRVKATISVKDWEFKEARLIRELNNTVFVSNQDEGLLHVTLVVNHTGEEKNGTVCGSSRFGQLTAQLLCQSMGFQIEKGVWGREPSYKYVPE